MEYNKDSWQGPTIYTGNTVTDELVKLTKEKCEEVPEVHVSFDVIGRTCHLQLACQLEAKLGKDYDVDIDYMMYKCLVKRRR